MVRVIESDHYMGLKDRGYSGDASMEDAKGAINRSRRAGALTSNAHADSNGSGVTNGNGGVTNGNGILNGYDEHDSINFEADTSIYNAALDAEHVLDSMLDAFIEVDSDGVILLWNGKAEEMFGWSRSEVVGCYVQDMIVPERYRELYNNQVLVEAIKMAYKGTGEVAERNIILKKRDGTEIPVLSRAYAYKDGNTIRIGGSVRDTSTLRTMEERLASAYLRDQLTGLPNRAYLTYQVNYLLARDSDDLYGKAEVAIAAVDIDRFTAINDAYGQEVGDEVLIEVSSRLSSIAGDGALLGRFGADEFFVCFDGDGATERAEEFARRSLESFKDPVSTSKGYLYIDVSVGVGSSGSGNLFGSTQDFDRSLDLLEQGKNHLDHAVSVTGDATVSTAGDATVSTAGDATVSTAGDATVSATGDTVISVTGDAAVSGTESVPVKVDASLLFSSADMAMQNAKVSGRNSHVVFGENMRQEIIDRVDTKMGLHRAMESNELRLFYQPVVDIHGQDMVGVEALIRWDNPDKGLVPPDRFIPVAEDSGLIIPIGEWVLESACSSFSFWDGPKWQWSNGVNTVGVNLSARQIDHPGLVDAVEKVISDSGIDPHRLTLEITESALMKDAAAALGVMSSLKSLGVALSVDDFGTGYSSLSYLQRFPLDVLKIDKSFIDDLGIDNQAGYLVKAIIDLAHALKLEVIAEGVETEMQLEVLQKMNCDFVQGFLFSKPMPTDRLLDEFSLPRL